MVYNDGDSVLGDKILLTWYKYFDVQDLYGRYNKYSKVVLNDLFDACLHIVIVKLLGTSLWL